MRITNETLTALAPGQAITVKCVNAAEMGALTKQVQRLSNGLRARRDGKAMTVTVTRMSYGADDA